MKHIFLIFLVILITSCTAAPAQPVAVQQPTDTPQANMPNPASVFCEEQGYTLEIRTAEDGSQAGFCVFPDGSDCDEWAFLRGECAPAEVNNENPDPSSDPTQPTSFPTPLPIDSSYYQGFWTYTHPVYNFSIMLPEDWIVEEVTTGDALMNEHALNLRPEYEEGKERIRMVFRSAGEDILLWPTGVGQGEFVPNGSLDVAGEPAQRVLLVCPNGEVTAIWYHQAEGQPNITRGNMEFSFIFSGANHCEEGYSLSGKVQLVGELIIASLDVP